MTAYCCEDMRTYSVLSCRHHGSPHQCPDVLVLYDVQYGPALPVHDGGDSYVVIRYCPWCGARLYNSNRSKRQPEGA